MRARDYRDTMITDQTEQIMAMEIALADAYANTKATRAIAVEALQHLRKMTVRCERAEANVERLRDQIRRLLSGHEDEPRNPDPAPTTEPQGALCH